MLEQRGTAFATGYIFCILKANEQLCEIKFVIVENC